MQAEVLPGALLVDVQAAVVAMYVHSNIIKMTFRVCIHRPLEDHIQEIEVSLHTIFSKSLAQLKIGRDVGAMAQRLCISRSCSSPYLLLKMVPKHFPCSSHTVWRLGINGPASALSRGRARQEKLANREGWQLQSSVALSLCPIGKAHQVSPPVRPNHLDTEAYVAW